MKKKKTYFDLLAQQIEQCEDVSGENKLIVLCYIDHILNGGDLCDEIQFEIISNHDEVRFINEDSLLLGIYYSAIFITPFGRFTIQFYNRIR
jgi:hypothetical protein